MWLYIDTRNRSSSFFGWLKQGQEPKLWQVSDKDNGLVSAIARRIAPKQISDSDGICVVSGPGSFSSIRIGTLTANLIARIHGLPLFAVDAETADRGSGAIVGSIVSSSPQEYAAPVYDREPNITISNK